MLLFLFFFFDEGLPTLCSSLSLFGEMRLAALLLLLLLRFFFLPMLCEACRKDPCPHDLRCMDDR